MKTDAKAEPRKRKTPAKRPAAEKGPDVPVHRSAQAPLHERALRTKQHILTTAMNLFLQRSYAATTIDNIADAAGVSRASFYTYFSSKREVMIVGGHECRLTSLQLLEDFGRIDPDDLMAGIQDWITSYYGFLETNGGYLLTWQQAALHDPDMRKTGMRGSQKAGRVLATSLQKLGVEAPVEDLAIRGLAILAMLDRFWYLWWIVKAPFSRKQVLDNLTLLIYQMIGTQVAD